MKHTPSLSRTHQGEEGGGDSLTLYLVRVPGQKKEALSLHVQGREREDVPSTPRLQRRFAVPSPHAAGEICTSAAC